MNRPAQATGCGASRIHSGERSGGVRGGTRRSVPPNQKSYPIQKPKSQPLLVVAKSVYFVQSKWSG